MKVSMELAKEIWDQSPHTWKGFHHTLQDHADRFSNLPSGMDQALLKLSADMEATGNDFPTSAEHLYHMLAERLPAEAY